MDGGGSLELGGAPRGGGLLALGSCGGGDLVMGVLVIALVNGLRFLGGGMCFVFRDLFGGRFEDT